MIKSLFALAIAGSSLQAQSSRFAVTPHAGHVWATPIFEHDVVFSYPAAPSEHLSQRLSVNAAPLVGVSADLRANAWVLYANVSFAPTTVHFHELREVSAVFLSESQASNDASIDVSELGFGRIFHASERIPEIRATLGGGLYRFNLKRRSAVCGPPSVGVPSCSPEDPWAGHYNVASLVGGIMIRKPIGAHFGLDLGGKASFGKANTEGFFVDYLQEFDDQEAPKRYSVRTTQISVGLSIF
jgi:hypothetical protein